jgi:hypothetical protein
MKTELIVLNPYLLGVREASGGRSADWRPRVANAALAALHRQDEEIPAG